MIWLLAAWCFLNACCIALMARECAKFVRLSLERWESQQAINERHDRCINAVADATDKLEDRTR